MGRPLRILYAAGPGDVLGTYRHWKEGVDDPSQVSVTYSGQFYDVCRELGARAYVLASCRTPGFFRDGPFTIRHRPVPFEDGPGPLYHLGQVWSGLRLLAWACRHGPSTRRGLFTCLSARSLVAYGWRRLRTIL